MKKNLIALAIASAFVAPIAMADTTVYGQANASVASVNNGTNSVMKVSSDSSRLGFKGSEDLGGGTSVVYQMESAINLDNDGTAGTSTTLATRNSYVGLSDAGMGTVLAGRHDTPYKIATRSLDVFADTIADNRNLMGVKGNGGVANFDARQGNIVAYISPVMSSVTVAAAYVTINETKTPGTDTAVSLAAMYAEGPLSASLAYESHTLDSVALKESAVKLGGSYTIDALTLNAVYETTRDAGKHKGAYAAAKYNLGGGDAVKAAYAKALNGTQVTVGYDHSMSKRTTVYALYTTLANKDGANNGLAGGNSTGGFATVGADQDPNAFSLGLKHSF